jgi:hypothetical protein
MVIDIGQSGGTLKILILMLDLQSLMSVVILYPWESNLVLGGILGSHSGFTPELMVGVN